jgi:cytochrome P450
MFALPKRLRRPAVALPPGPRGVPVLGTLPAFNREPLGFLLDVYRRHGELVTLPFPGPPRVAIFAPELVNEMLVAAEHLIDKTTLGGFFGLGFARAISGTGIITTTGEEHRLHRQVVLRAFGNQYLAGYQALIREVTEAVLGRWAPGSELDLVPEITLLGKRIASRLLFGLDMVEAPGAVGRALDEVTATLDSSTRVFTASLIPWDVPAVSNGGTIRRHLRLIDGWFRELAEKAENRSLGQTLLRLGAETEGWGVERVRDNLIQLYMTGYDTTTCAATWTLYLLAQHPQACATLLRELSEQLGSRAPGLEELHALRYLDAVVKESLRLYPTGPYGFRQTRRELQLGGYTLPEGLVLVYSPWVTHRIPRVFPEPEAFRPERFTQGHSPPKGAYVPFGQGMRSCVAATLATLQVKTMVAMILQRFRLDVVPHQEVNAVSLNAIHLLPGLRVRVSRQDGQTDRSPAPVYGNVASAMPH